MNTEAKLSHAEATESLFSLHLFWSVNNNKEHAAALRTFSLENNLFQTVSRSLAVKLDIPFILCMTGRGETYYARNDETDKTLGNILNKGDEITAVDINEAWHSTINDMTNPLLNEEPPRSQSEDNEDRQTTKFLSFASALTEEEDHRLIQLITKSWAIHNEMLSEVLTSINVQDHIGTIDDNFLSLINLPESITSEYQKKFSPLIHEIPYTDADEYIFEIKSHTEEYDAPDTQVTLGEVMQDIRSKISVCRQFQSRISNLKPSSVIRVFDTSANGFLNYPFPPL